ncbi:MAG: SBBP repeat-containing protein, partial [Burkholderiales bacterium]|nr:SBBP repeat-containing protein [Burkholderiales bacterium]
MWWRRKRRPAVERALAEPLEPRILYAADLGAGLALAGSGWAAEDVVDEVVDARVLDPVPAPAHADPAVPPSPGADAAARQAALPLNFETNRGQADASIDFIARGSGVAIALSDGAATLALKDGGHTDVVRMDLAGAATDVQGRAEGEVSARSNYFVGTPDRWLTDVPNHAAVRYDGVYDGIDLRYYGNGRALEYDFIVAAGADAGAIALEFSGVDRVAVDPDGALRLTIDGPDGARSLHFAAPVSYQDGPDGRESVASRYVIGADGRVRFEIGAYDAGRALVIDPVLIYGSYLGGSGFDSANGIAVDGAGNVYLAGETASAAFPTSAGALDTAQNGGSDVFVTKLNAAGTAVVYSTFVGGSGTDAAHGIAVDAAGNAYVAGSTRSANLPTAGAFQSALSGAEDAFFFKLNAGGNALTYATYYGGTGGGDIAYAVAVDAAGMAYVAGSTDAATGIASAGAYDTTLGGSSDAFLVKFDPTQSGAASRVFGTYLGGTGGENGFAVAVDAAGKAHVTGYTGSSDLPTTNNAYDKTVNGGGDAFLAVFNAAGSAVTYATYFGGAGTDSAAAIAIDTAGRVHVGGSTASSGLPTKNAYDTSYGGGSWDAFVARFDPTLSENDSLVHATYVGGAGDDQAAAITVDALGRAHLTGSTTGSFPTTADARQATYAGGAYDAFYATLGSLGSSLVYSTYLGGSADDIGHAIVRDAADKVYIAGATGSNNLQPISAGAYDTTHNGGGDAFVLGFASQTLTVTTTNDVVDGNTASISALLADQGADGLISLREAILATNNTAGADAIALPAGTYRLTRAGSGEDAAATGDLDILDALTIVGAGSSATVVDGNALDRVLHLQSAASLSDLTIRGGMLGANLWGGGVLVDSGASLSLARAIVSDNSTGSGAGIYNYGTLTAVDTTVSHNAGAGWGGGIYNDGGVVTLERVTISGNTSSKDGGGINNAGSGAALSLTNVTVSGNTATGVGGGIYTNRAITITNSTIALNSSAGGADGIHIQGGGSATLANTILYNPAGINSNAALISVGGNLDSDGTAGLGAVGDSSGTAGTPLDPHLGALQDNGGTVRTHALLAGSPGINAGTAAGAPATDARGVARLGAADIGAHESTLVAYEPFAYAAGSLNGANGGSGWAAGWGNVGTSTAVTAGGLQHADVDMQVNGGSAQLTIPLVLGSVSQARDLSSSLGAATGTTWLSFLVQPASTATDNYIGLQFGDPAGTRAFAGINGNQFVLEQYGGAGRVVVGGIAPTAGQTYLLAVRLDMTAGADGMTLYVNPTPGQAAPDATLAANKSDLDLGTFARIDLAGGRTLATNNAMLDEIRVAGSYLDVAPQRIQTAPVLDASRSPQLSTVAEDAGGPSGAAGTLVSSIVDLTGGGGGLDNITDADSSPVTGIAVTSADGSSGAWWFSTDGGANWSALGAVSETSARLLAADTGTRLYFQPNANVSGTL